MTGTTDPPRSIRPHDVQYLKMLLIAQIFGLSKSFVWRHLKKQSVDWITEMQLQIYFKNSMIK